ncbi:hypothetical protein [Halanaerobium saccharolyticum]|uniref:hypothetical protein n=1 Tax=Halanaerobium saccharolyticum TaxID=43595 RepID=UPI001FBA9B22|nr:hypothetical protein [Halanaerobium saccharolyticum]
MNNKIIFLAVLLVFLATPFVEAESFESPESFTEYVYANYADENFEEVYNNFAAELKRVLAEEDYLEFQQHNFEKYKLEYTEIEVGTAEEITFEEIEAEFEYARDFGSYYRLQVSYLLKFSRLGRREERSEKDVYLRKINDDFQIFWDYESALSDDQAANRDDQDE